MRKLTAVVALGLLTGCAPMSRVRRLETQNYELDRYVRGVLDANKLMAQRLEMSEKQMEFQATLIQQAREVSSVCGNVQQKLDQKAALEASLKKLDNMNTKSSGKTN